MDDREWQGLLQSYTSVEQVVDETLEGLGDHLNTKCNKGQTQTVATQSAGRRGLPPFHEKPLICDRGSSGCNLVHNDGQALKFSLMAFDRIKELVSA